MLSDEERKAIENLKGTYWYVGEEGLEENIKIILNLIEKQQKEIEELKEKADANLAYYDQIYQNGIYTGQRAVEDKIKAKIEEYDETLYYAETEEGMAELKDYEYDEAKYGKKVLQSLLEKE